MSGGDGGGDEGWFVKLVVVVVMVVVVVDGGVTDGPMGSAHDKQHNRGRSQAILQKLRPS